MGQELGLARARRVAGGSYLEAAILDRILFWYPKAKLEIEGHLWMVKTHSEFVAELGDFHKNSLCNVLKRLRERGIIETFTGQHPYKMGMHRATFIRVLSEEERASANVTNGVTLISQGEGKQCHKPCDTICTQGIDIAVTVGQPASTTGEDQKQTLQGGEKEAKDGQGKGMEKVRIKTNGLTFAGGLAIIRPQIADTVQAVEQVWRAAHAEAYQDKYKGVAWSMAQKGMAKGLIARVGNGGVLAKALGHTILHWANFRAWLMEVRGVKKVPDYPELQYMAGFADRMVDFWQDGDALSGLPKSSEGGLAGNCNEVETEIIYKSKSLAVALAEMAALKGGK